MLLNRILIKKTVTPRQSLTVLRSLSNNTRDVVDIVVAGGGMVGSAAAIVLANLGNHDSVHFIDTVRFTNEYIRKSFYCF